MPDPSTAHARFGTRAVSLFLSSLLTCTAQADDLRLLYNSLGYTPGAAKLAAVSGGVAPNAVLRFELVDVQSGEIRLKGKSEPSAPWAPAQTVLRVLDFSALRQPGEYRLQVEGLPPSAPFVVGPTPYAALNAAAIQAYTYNRSGMALSPEWAGKQARPAGHPDTAVSVHPSAAGPKRQAGDVIASPKGWYDAGDYNKYIVNSAITVSTLLSAYEHYPQHFKAQHLALPESGNGLPDLLNELLWNLDWMLSMQDPDDGGVYHKLTNLGFDGMVLPHEATAPRYVVGKSTAAALDFAATLAHASRVMQAFEAQRPGYSAQLLAAAQRAWDWAEQHPDRLYVQPADVGTGTYDDSDLRDEVAWAAAELWASTGEARFRAALQPHETLIDVPGWNQVSALAWTALAELGTRATPADRRLARQRLLGLADHLLARWRASPLRISLSEADWVWGSNAVLLNQGLVLVQAYRLSGRRPYLDAAQSALDYVLGRNALGRSMVTGLGEQPPQHPHHRPSAAQGHAVPGFLVGGPNPGQQDSGHCPLPYPSKAPALAYLDHVCSYASNEVAINWNAPLVYLSAALQALTPPATSARRPPRPPPPTAAARPS